MIRKISADRVSPRTGGTQKEERVTPSSPIGIFDSGVGGLTVLRQIMKKLSHEDVIYLGDTARIPFGGRSTQEILKINQEILSFLMKHGAKLIIMACGTSSAVAYPVLKDEYPVHMINLIDPGARAAVEATRSGRIGLIATAATVGSGAFQNKIKELDGKLEVHAVSCPLFVPLIEGGMIESEETKQVAKEYLKSLLAEKIDTLVLGCTHYPHLTKILREITGSDVVLVDPALEAAEDTRKILKKSGTPKLPPAPPAKYEYLVTSHAMQFQELGSRLLGKPIVGTRQVQLT